MSRIRRILVTMGAFLFAAGLQAADLNAIRLGLHDGHTRVVIELSQEIEFKVTKKQDKNKLEVKLLNITGNKVPPSPQVGKGYISSYKLVRGPQKSLILQIETKHPSQILKSYTMPKKGKGPFRVVIDVAPTHSQNETPNISVSGFVPMPFIKPIRKVVAIDAGHGGQDPGTISPKGYQEKDITLAVAHEMKRLIDKSGKYMAVLTRTDDRHLPLRARFSVAREANANLLISLHADSNPNSQVKGVSVYTLSDRASDKEAQRLAEKENAADFLEDLKFDPSDAAEVKNILIDLSQTRSRNHSVQFAGMLTAKFQKHELLPKNSHRFADFAVLKAPDVASVLLELGYLSNPKDEKRLSSREYQRKIAALIVSAIDDYFEQVKS